MRQRISTIWNYFDLIQSSKGRGNFYATCKYCPKNFDTRSTTSMFLHLKSKHEEIYPKALDDRRRHPIHRKRVRKTINMKPKKQKRIRERPSRGHSSDTKPKVAIEVIEEPNIIFEEELVYVSDNSNDSYPEVSKDRVLSPLLLPLRITDNSSSLPICTEDSQIEEKNEVQPISLEAGASQQDSCNNTEECKFENTVTVDNSNMLSCISLDLKFIKDAMFDKDRCFYLSVASEFDLLAEESKDLVKAAIWHVIYEVKRAKRKNVDLSIFNLFK